MAGNKKQRPSLAEIVTHPAGWGVAGGTLAAPMPFKKSDIPFPFTKGFKSLPRRKKGVALAVAAALGLAGFGGGYLFGSGMRRAGTTALLSRERGGRLSKSEKNVLRELRKRRNA
jgi:hypothetical protein